VKTHSKLPEGVAVGATGGGAIGAIAAGLAAVGALAIPGVGILAAGPIVAALAGAAAGGAAGGLIGGLIGLGIPEHEATTRHTVNVITKDPGIRNNDSADRDKCHIASYPRRLHAVTSRRFSAVAKKYKKADKSM
jgi:hypothetical protein